MRVSTVLIVVAASVLLIYAALLRSWPILNIVETGKTPEYPDIQSRMYHASREQTFDAVRRAVQGLPRWNLVADDPGSGEVKAEATSRVFRFVDDVRIRVSNREDVAVVDARSASRIGRGDFGQNARNIRTLFRALDQEMNPLVKRS